MTEEHVFDAKGEFNVHEEAVDLSPYRFEDWLAFAITSRLSRMVLSGSPRRPSFAPSSMITTAGRCCFSNAGKRVRPPLVVSPLMLAFTTV